MLGYFLKSVTWTFSRKWPGSIKLRFVKSSQNLIKTSTPTVVLFSLCQCTLLKTCHLYFLSRGEQVVGVQSAGQDEPGAVVLDHG